MAGTHQVDQVSGTCPSSHQATGNPLPHPSSSLGRKTPDNTNVPSTLILNKRMMTVKKGKELLLESRSQSQLPRDRPLKLGNGVKKGSFSRQLALHPQVAMRNMRTRKPVTRDSTLHSTELEHFTGLPNTHPLPISPQQLASLGKGAFPQGATLVASRPLPKLPHIKHKTNSLHSPHPDQTWLHVSSCLPSNTRPVASHKRPLSIHVPKHSPFRPFSEEISTMKSASNSSGLHESVSHHSSDHLITGADIASGELLLLDQKGKVIHQVSEAGHMTEDEERGDLFSIEQELSNSGLKEGCIAPPPSAQDVTRAHKETSNDTFEADLVPVIEADNEI